MDFLLQEYPWYPPKDENLISFPSTNDGWELEPCSTIYDTMYRIFPEHKKIDIIIEIKEPVWNYLDDNTASIKLIREEDLPAVNKFLMEEYVFHNPLWKEYGVTNETETYKVYRDLLENVISEGNSLLAKSGERLAGILLCSVLEADRGDVELFDPKLGQVMAAEGFFGKLSRLLQLTYVRSWALVRLLQTGVDITTNEDLTEDALLRAVWEWTLTKDVDCIVVYNSSDKRRPAFKKHGYTAITAAGPLKDDSEDKQSGTDNTKLQTDNKIGFFIKFSNKNSLDMFNYTKGHW